MEQVILRFTMQALQQVSDTEVSNGQFMEHGLPFLFDHKQGNGMSSLQKGYVVDVPYPTFVHREAMPLWLNTVSQMHGYKVPDLKKPFRYLELGCAMGIHLHLTAALYPQGQFTGVDFNPHHLLVAEEGLQETEIQNIQFIQASFDEALELNNLEPFDFIVTHGVWSWIDEKQQQAMVNIVDRWLKPGGIFYCSYMSHPGATGMTSVQKLMFEMSRNLKGSSATKAVQGLNLARKIGQSQTGLFQQIPSLNHQLEQLAGDKPNYIAHDFLSEHWQPQHSADMIRRFGKIRLAYTAGAGLLENIDTLNLTPDVVKIVQQLPLVTLQETVRDIARNTQQRQDIYIRDREKLTKSEKDQFYQFQKFGLLPGAPAGQSLKLDSKIGHIQDAIPVFENILSVLKIRALSLAEIKAAIQISLSEQQWAELIQVLIWAGYVHPCAVNEVQVDADYSAMNKWMELQELSWRCHPEFSTALEH